MIKQRTTTTDYVECDGCQYLVGRTEDERARGITAEEVMTSLRIPWYDGEGATFHFHGPGREGGRHDCFRYWAHSPRIMERSLRERDWAEDEIDEFMAIHLYRNHSGDPGIERPKTTTGGPSL